MYTKVQTCEETQNTLLQNIKNKGTEEQSNQITKPLSKHEIKEAISQMENQKSPGVDGIPIDFYKEYYNLLEEDLHQLYRNILFKEKQSTKTMKQAIITLISKKDKDLEDLKNWRPISLL